MKLTIRIPAWFLLLAYIVAGFATYGWSYNSQTQGDWCFNDGQQQYGCYHGPHPYINWWPQVHGAFWPIYWAGNIAIRTVKP